MSAAPPASLRTALASLFRRVRDALALFALAVVVAVAMPLPQGVPAVQAAIDSLVGGATAGAAPVPVLPAQERGTRAAADCADTPLAQATPEAQAEIALPPGSDAASAPDPSAQEREERAVAEFIARRYRVAESDSTAYVSSAYRSGQAYALDPLLILAVMAVESSYNPQAESHMGARGLMQIIPRWHPEKLEEHGGAHALLDPEVNIQVGARILREYLARAGEMRAALQMYNGAHHEPTARYAGKVLAEQARLQQFLVAALGGD